MLELHLKMLKALPIEETPNEGVLILKGLYKIPDTFKSAWAQKDYKKALNTKTN